MNLELTNKERLVIMAALTSYQRNKGAERMLEAHKMKSAADMAPVFARYDALLALANGLHKRLQEDSGGS